MKIRRIILTMMAAFALQANAQTPQNTFEKLAKGGTLNIGVRATSSPLSYTVDGKSTGLAVELCKDFIFEGLKQKFPEANYKFVEVTSANRIDMLKEGKIDIECGSTTNTASRRKEVLFTTPYYFASVVAIKLVGNPLTSIADLDEHSRVIYTAGTTTEKALAGASIGFKVKSQQKIFSVVLGKDHQDSFDLLTNGKGDIFANDDILLLALKERSANPSFYELLNEKYSVEPYSLMIRKEDQELYKFADKTTIELMKSGKFTVLYDKWFMKPIPPFNKAMNIPMGKLLKDTVRFPSNYVGN